MIKKKKLKKLKKLKKKQINKQKKSKIQNKKNQNKKNHNKKKNTNQFLNHQIIFFIKYLIQIQTQEKNLQKCMNNMLKFQMNLTQNKNNILKI